MAAPTKTLHPLPFEHLEPRRFEDLIRQLAYEFRNWRALEATGRSGGDEGYDIRGWEIVPDADLSTLDLDDDETEAAATTSPENDREWLFQCKREKSIGPAKLERYLDEIGQDTLNGLYGLIFAVSCNLSKRSRDLFRSKCREAGIAECYIWSSGELEDMLFQPKNDGLLFAYFGISLKIRQRSIKTELRARLATKRKVRRALGDGDYLGEPILLRDPEDDRYPYISDEDDRDNHRWKVVKVTEIDPLGVLIEWMSYYAYLDEDNIHWDMADAFNNTARHFDDPWLDEEARQKTLDIHRYQNNEIDEKCRGTFVVDGLLHFEDIMEIDPDGDVVFERPHFYVSFSDNQPPIYGLKALLTVPAVFDSTEGGPVVQIAESRQISLLDPVENRIEVYPQEFRKAATE